MEQSNVNNLNGVPNFGHGLEDALSVPTSGNEPSIDENNTVSEDSVNGKKPHKSKVRSAAQKTLGGKY